ncbi:MAG: VOC family protein [Pseudomonas sp.]|nr:VOC family protein [Pseudomonas sp.]
MIKGLHHVAISTPNMARLLDFYRGHLGFEELSRTSWPAGTGMINRVLGLEDSAATTVMLQGRNLCLELFEFSLPKEEAATELRPVSRHGFTHICIDVVDIDKVYQEMLAAGVRFHCPPQEFGVSKATYGRDPDGNVFELQEVFGS